MKVSPDQLLPSQSFLKPDTIAYILKCYKTNRLGDLPPNPIVRKDGSGNLVAIDGHNLIAVKLHRGEEIDIHLAQHAEDGLSPTSDANIKRNLDLKEKFETVLTDRAYVEAEGILTFRELISQYPNFFRD
jgi:hypothetical protein